MTTNQSDIVSQDKPASPRNYSHCPKSKMRVRPTESLMVMRMIKLLADLSVPWLLVSVNIITWH